MIKWFYDNSILFHIYYEEIVKHRMFDHCHLSGKFRGDAHEVCDLKYKVPTFFPVVFHNIRLISSDKVAQKLAAKPNYVSCTIFDEPHCRSHKEDKSLL